VGGDAFYLLWLAAEQRATVIHAAAPSAARATLELYAGGIAYTGPLAAMPPGVAAGWQHLVDHYASRPARELFAPAIAHAREGFAATRGFCRDASLYASQLAKDPGCAAVFLRDGKAPALGATIANPALARTLETIAERGAGELHGGALGRALCLFIERGGGVITLDDLAGHRAEEHPPLERSYRDLTVLNAGPPTMGFALLIELAIAGAFDLGSMEYLSADHLHTLIEAKKLAFVEREELAGDPAHVRAAEGRLLGEPAEELAERIDPRRAAALVGRPTRSGDTT
jgi:gamma-glutamyltranspeptidase